jgi:hypothetical protein
LSTSSEQIVEAERDALLVERDALQAALDDLVMTREYGTNRYGKEVLLTVATERYNQEWATAYGLSEALKKARAAEAPKP